jgi:hypothetical protein
MKRSTKILLAVFIAAAVSMYVYIYAVPQIQGMSERTAVLEYGDLPVVDRTEVLFVRNETLYGAGRGGALDYKQKEGTKVRKGVKLISIEDGSATVTSSAVEHVRENAGDAIEMTDSCKADKTAVVSYYGDGYERALSEETLLELTREDAEKYPETCAQLKRAATAVGDPIYKLTDNNRWYMVYWRKAGADKPENYEKDNAVKVRFGDVEVDAKVYETTAQGDYTRIILQSDMYYESLTRLRKVDADIVFSEHRGLLAERKYMVERNGQQGLFVKQRSGSYKWAPINIIDEVDGKCTLSVGVYYDKEGKQIKTVNYYDEVLANPKEEGYS